MTDAAANLKIKPEPASYDGYRVVVEPSDQRIRVMFRGETVADSTRALVMHETRLPSAFYFPRDDVRMDLMERTDRRTHCPFKGNASYWTLRVGEHEAENAVWSYEDPFDEASSVKDYIGFIWDAVDAWIADDGEALEQPRHEGTVKDNPFIGWLINEAWKAKSSPDLVKCLAEGLVAAGFPLWRLRVVIRTLNPQLFAIIHTWQKDVDEIGEFHATHEELELQRFVSSPFAAIIRGEGGVRRRLEGSGARLDFPILEDLVAEGATDYVAMPMCFSDGQINIVTLVSDRSGGFSTGDLGQLYEILPTLSRLLEAHAQRVSSLTLLRTYLGRNAGERVMNGKVKRGDGEDLHAVIWFSDLRGSTAMADSMGREAYLATLNQYFDGVAGAVIEQGGEVLKFIGDAILAIFVIDDPADPAPEACTRALAAAADAGERIAAVNGEREARGEPALAFGVGLHRGNLTYGNIGTERRLDFTVIGPAVNEAARIEDLCKTLETSVLMSEALAASIPGETNLLSLGRHVLRGVRTPQEIFTLPPQNDPGSL